MCIFTENKLSLIYFLVIFNLYLDRLVKVNKHVNTENIKMSDSKKPVVFAYNNFRSFLRDLYHYEHSLNIKFNKSYICREIGLPNSRSYFQDVLNGKVVSSQKIELFCKIFKLNKKESNFFRVLVNYNQMQNNADQKELLFDQLVSLNQTPKEVISRLQYSYYKSSHNSAIRAILDTIDFKDDYKELSELLIPNITIKKAKDSIKLLSALGLIKRNSDGFYKPTNKVISTGEKIKSDVIKHYQMASLEAARNVISSNSEQPQRVITKMLSLSESAYKLIEKKIEKFNSEVTSIVHKDENSADRVYQLDIVLFPQAVSKK